MKGLLILLSSFILLSCRERVDARLDTNQDGARIEINITEFQVKHIQDIPSTFLYGDLQIYNLSDDTLYYFLGNYQLSLWDLESKDIYIGTMGVESDRYYFYQENGTLLNPRDTILYENVYWAYENYALTKENVREINLKITDRGKEWCKKNQELFFCTKI